MAIYDFICGKCKEELTIESSIHAATPEPYCFKCKVKMNRHYEPTGTIFKGDGWAGKR